MSSPGICETTHSLINPVHKNRLLSLPMNTQGINESTDSLIRPADAKYLLSPLMDAHHMNESTHSIASPVRGDECSWVNYRLGRKASTRTVTSPSSDDKDSILNFTDFIRACAPVDEPLPDRFVDARRSSSVYTRNTQFISLHGTETPILHGTPVPTPVPRLSPSAYFLQPSNYHSSNNINQHQLDDNNDSPQRPQSTCSTAPPSADIENEKSEDSESVSPSTRLVPYPTKNYPQGVTSPDISPLMTPVSSTNQNLLPPPEAYLDRQYTPPPETFYSEDTITEAFEEPLFPVGQLTSSPEAISVTSQLMNPLLFSRPNKAYEALGVNIPDEERESPQNRRRPSSHSYSRFRAALRSMSRDDTQSIKQATSHRSTSTSSGRSLISTHTATTPASAVIGVKQLLTDDYHQSISEQARVEREGSMSSTFVKKEMKLIPAPLFQKDGSMRHPTENDSAAKWPEFQGHSDHSSSEQEHASTASKAKIAPPKRSLTTRGHRYGKKSMSAPGSRDGSSPSTATTSPRTPTSSRPSTSTNPSSSASPLTPTLTKKSPATPTRSKTSPGRLLLRAAPGLFRSDSKKLQKENKSSKKGHSIGDKEEVGNQWNKTGQEANDAWRQQIKQTIKVVGEKDPNEVDDMEQSSEASRKSGKRSSSRVQRGVKSSTSNAVRDHLGWDRARAKASK